MPPTAKRIAQVITNSFEHSTTTIEYDHCRDIGDGRGYTCGSIGFTTGTGDALILVEDYEKSKGTKTSFAPFNTELGRLSNRTDCGGSNSDITGLIGFDQAWKRESCDEKFRRAQDKLADTMYFLPAMGLATEVGVKSNLGKAIFYDTAIQHGWEADNGMSLKSIIKMVGAYKEEAEYLNRFLKTRWKLLCCFPDQVWPASSDRVHELFGLLEAKNFDLNLPIRLSSYQITISGSEYMEKTCEGKPLTPICNNSKCDPNEQEKESGIKAISSAGKSPFHPFIIIPIIAFGLKFRH
ncbi:hypothetical protein K7432_008221 [Basidiobolus ranarum]|uniref:Chitosanase n=1 Tax=Basidiobolus ranarum TaxID=34480 RepID=A0ABR2VZ50_9FUNG